jgi:hypothetical protein
LQRAKAPAEVRIHGVLRGEQGAREPAFAKIPEQGVLPLGRWLGVIALDAQGANRVHQRERLRRDAIREQEAELIVRHGWIDPVLRGRA